MLWIRLLRRAAEDFVIKFHFSNQTQPRAVVLKAALLLGGHSEVYLHFNSPPVPPGIEFHSGKRRDLSRICPTDSAPNKNSSQKFPCANLGLCDPPGLCIHPFRKENTLLGKFWLVFIGEEKWHKPLRAPLRTCQYFVGLVK